MPFIRVELYRGRTLEQKKAFAEAVTKAAVEILETRTEAVRIRFEEFDPEDIASGGVYPAQRPRP